jgi:biopolymer transport protein TolR
VAAQLPSARGKGRRVPMADINVTPLVDVMLVLLIIFMVTAPLMTAGVPVNLPDSRAKALEQDKKPVSISIERDGTIYLDDKEVGEDVLSDALVPIAAKRDADGKPPQVLLRADKGLDYGRVMAVMGDLNRAGLNRVSLVSNIKAER